LSFPISSFPIFVFPFLPFSTLDGYQCLLRRNSWTKSRQKSLRVFLLVLTVPSTALPWLLYFFKLKQPLTVSVKEKGGKPKRKPYPLLYDLRNPSLRTLKIFPETSMKLYVHEFGCWYLSFHCTHSSLSCSSIRYSYICHTFSNVQNVHCIYIGVRSVCRTVLL
jgi:hypothetical protein